MQLDVLAVGAHPDDVELSCGGTLIRLASLGYATGVIALTRGELGTRGGPEIRAEEFQASSEILQLSSCQILSIPDGRIEDNWENRLTVIRAVREYRPHLILAPYWEDRHPDHAGASLLVRHASYLSGLKQIDTNQKAHRPHRMIHYPCRVEFSPTFIVDVSDFHDRKMQAILAYKSQFHHPDKGHYGKEETNISRPEFLETIVSRARVYGSHIGAKYGEPFLVREPLRIDDPVSFFGRESLQSFL